MCLRVPAGCAKPEIVVSDNPVWGRPVGVAAPRNDGLDVS